MSSKIWHIPLVLTDFNIIVAVLGGFISLFGLRNGHGQVYFELSADLMMAVISLLAGVAFGPHGANFIRPASYADCGRSHDTCEKSLDSITLNFSRLVLAVQLVLAGVQLPSKYLWREWKPTLLLVGPGMTLMWLATSLLVWALVKPPSFLHALAVGACVTPTDPVLSAVIVKGKFADRNIPKELQNLIVAESGANDGLGYPFLFFALYLIKFTGPGAPSGSAGDAMGLWFGMTWGYTILLSIIYGAVVGWVAKELLHWAEERNYVDRESFLVFAISLALFVLGTCGLFGTDDVLACFVAGNVFTWDDWFRLETKDDSLQPTIDMLLNVTIFMWYGAVIPWEEFGNNRVIPIYRLIGLGLLVLVLRRLPWIFGLHRWIHQIESTRHAIFVGFFGPIGVSAVFYLFIAVEFIDEHLSDVDEHARLDVSELAEILRVVVWFLVVCSVIVHGLSIPLGRLGYLAPRTLSRVISESLSDAQQVAATKSPLAIFGWFADKRRRAESGGRGSEGVLQGEPGLPAAQEPASNGARISRPFHPRRMHGASQGSHGRERELTEDDNWRAPTRDIRFFDEVSRDDGGHNEGSNGNVEARAGND
ncbi:Na(+)/H(+) antiporter 2 [Paramyrothecium foliicola]|nr:Na(+)/H(+) antiporter 2 [Paramyrothecium foliicola]